MSIYTAQMMAQLEASSAEYTEQRSEDNTPGEKQLGKLLKNMGESVKVTPHLDLLNELEQKAISSPHKGKPGHNLSFG